MNQNTHNQVVDGMGSVGGATFQLALALSNRRSRRGSEGFIQAILLICGAFSILTTIGIVIILFQQAIEFFSEVSMLDFLFGTEWTPLFKGQESYGVLPLV